MYLICANKIISINYVENEIWWNQKEVNDDNNFAYNLPLYVITNNEDYEFKSIKVYRQRKAFIIEKINIVE